MAEHSLSLNDSQVEEVMKTYDDLNTFPDVEPALKKLAQIPSISSVVFTNGTKTMATNSVHSSSDLAPLRDAFKDIVTVDSVRAFKPAPEVYKHLAQRTDKSGSEGEIWLISGNPFDIVGARAVGMKAAWVDRAGNGWQDSLGDPPTAVLRSLEDVADVVQKYAKGQL